MCAYSYKEKIVLISDDLADDLVSPHDYPYLKVVPTSGTANHHPKPERAKVSVVGEPQFTWPRIKQFTWQHTSSSSLGEEESVATLWRCSHAGPHQSLQPN